MFHLFTYRVNDLVESEERQPSEWLDSRSK